MSGYCGCEKCDETIYWGVTDSYEEAKRKHSLICKAIRCADECHEICDEYPPVCQLPPKHEGNHLYENEEKTLRLEWKNDS